MQLSYPRNPRPRTVPIDDPMNSGGGDVRAADTDPSLYTGQPPEDIVADSTDDVYEYAQGFSMPHCPDNGIQTSATSDGTENTDPGSPSPPAADKNACHGVSGDYWVMSRDVAVDNVKDFCGQTDQTKKYNVGSVNELELSVKDVSDSTKGPKDAPDCVGRFTNAVIDGCDGNDPINNPHNYKFGSTLTTADGWEYKMTPLSQQVNEVACDVSYKFFFDGVEVRGKNWPDAKLGTNGDGLRQQLEGCGALTKWKFEMTPNDCCFQWYASGQLPIGTKACVGRAVQSAGGSGDGNCHGAGKRGLARRDNIDNWPGYGDDWNHVFGNSTSA
jgi:hypothetical protein